MLARFERFIKAPDFQDEDQTHLAKMFHHLIFITMTTMILIALSILLTKSQNLAADLPGLFSRVIVLFLAIPALAVLVLIVRRRNLELASWLYISIVWLTMTTAYSMNGGMRSSTYFGANMALMIVVSIFLGRWISFAYALVTVISAIAMTMAQNRGLLPQTGSAITSDGLLFIESLTFFSVVAIISIPTESIKIALARSRKEIVERTQVETALRESEERYRILAETARDSIFMVDSQGILTYVNDFAGEQLGLNPVEIVGRSIADLFPEEASERHHQDIQKVFETGQPLQSEDHLVFPDRELWLDTKLVPIHDTADQVHAVLGVSRDISQRKRVEETMQQSEKRFRALIEHSSDAISVLDDRGRVRYSSPSTARLFGCKLDEFARRSAFEKIHSDDLAVTTLLFNRLVEQPEASINSEFRLRHQDGSWRWVEAIGTNLLGDPAVRGIVVNYRDITERKRAEAQLIHDALHDALTGLPNRTLFMDRLEQAIRRAKRVEGSRYAVLFFDLDRFKVVNDSLGHTLGDRLLMEIAPRLEHCLRASDTFARLGGDEFVILLEDVADVRDVLRIAERIQMQLSLPFKLNGLELVISASIGIVLGSSHYDRAEDILRDADIAMYRAKAKGKARYEIFDAKMRADAVVRMELEADLRRALENQELRVFYQPILSFQEETLIGFEALVRWQHPERGLMVPAEFIPVAEESSLIIPIDRWVMREACRQMRDWSQRLSIEASLSINVNLSGKQFTRPDLIEQIERILEETGLSSSNLRVEITESAVLENLEQATSILQKLHNLGVQVAMDDFGTGYSSLSYLLQLPVDTLKIHRSFVSKMDADESKAEIVHTITTLAHSLGMDVVAEGVETEMQYARLKEAGCEYGQGFLLARPMDSQSAEVLLANQWKG